MYRIGYARNGISYWERRGQAVALGFPGDWNQDHVRSPSIVTAGAFTLMAYEGWNGSGDTGIGLVLGAERWIKADPSMLHFQAAHPGPEIQSITLINAGTGQLHLEYVSIVGNGFVLQNPIFPDYLTPGDSISLNVVFHDIRPGAYEGSIIIRSDAMFQPIMIIPLTANRF